MNLRNLSYLVIPMAGRKSKEMRVKKKDEIIFVFTKGTDNVETTLNDATDCSFN